MAEPTSTSATFTPNQMQTVFELYATHAIEARERDIRITNLLEDLMKMKERVHQLEMRIILW